MAKESPKALALVPEVMFKKVSRLALHSPTNIAGNVRGSVNIEKDGVTMMTTPIGIMIKCKSLQKQDVTRIVSYNNCYEFDLVDEGE